MRILAFASSLSLSVAYMAMSSSGLVGAGGGSERQGTGLILASLNGVKG